MSGIVTALLTIIHGSVILACIVVLLLDAGARRDRPADTL